MPQQQHSRRTVVRTAAWSVPVVASVAAAPAFAASPRCALQTLNWANGKTDGQKINPVSTSTSSVPGGPTTSVTVGSVGTPLAVSGKNLTVNTDLQGNVSPNLILQFDATTPRLTPTETVSFTFVPPVSDLTFTVLDIDSSNNTGVNSGDGIYYDQVLLTPGFNTVSKPSTVIGDGAVDPFHYVNNNTRVDPNKTAGNVTVNYPGPIAELTVTYFSTVPLTSSSMQVALSNFTFRQAGC